MSPRADDAADAVLGFGLQGPTHELFEDLEEEMRYYLTLLLLL